MPTGVLALYTTADAVRGALGLTSSELTDSMLFDQQLGAELEVDLYRWIPTHADLHAAGKASGATDVQKIKALYLELYAQWFIAKRALTVMQLAIPQMIGDGKSEMQRFQKFDFDKLSLRVDALVAYYRNLLSTSEGASTAATPPLAVISRPDYDPVAGA